MRRIRDEIDGKVRQEAYSDVLFSVLWLLAARCCVTAYFGQCLFEIYEFCVVMYCASEHPAEIYCSVQ